MYAICNGCGHADMRVNFYIMLLHEATCQSGANNSGITPKVEIPTVEVADGSPSNDSECETFSDSESVSQRVSPSQDGLESNFRSILEGDGGKVDVPARHVEKTTLSDTESSPFPRISPPELAIPTVSSRVNSGDMLPQPPELDVPTDYKADESMDSRVNRDIFEEYGRVKSKEAAPRKVFASQDFWSTRGGTAVPVPAGHKEKAKKVTVIEKSSPFPVDRVNRESTLKGPKDFEFPPPPELDISTDSRENVSTDGCAIKKGIKLNLLSNTKGRGDMAHGPPSDGGLPSPPELDIPTGIVVNRDKSDPFLKEEDGSSSDDSECGGLGSDEPASPTDPPSEGDFGPNKKRKRKRVKRHRGGKKVRGGKRKDVENTASESSPFPRLSPPKLDIPTVSRVNRDDNDVVFPPPPKLSMSKDSIVNVDCQGLIGDGKRRPTPIGVPQPPMLDISACNRANVSTGSVKSRDMSESSSFPKPVSTDETGSEEVIPLININISRKGGVIDKLRKEERRQARKQQRAQAYIVAQQRNKEERASQQQENWRQPQPPHMRHHYPGPQGIVQVPGGSQIRPGGSISVHDGSTVSEPARQVEKTTTFTATRCTPIRQISPPKLDIPHVSKMNRASHETGSHEGIPGINLNIPKEGGFISSETFNHSEHGRLSEGKDGDDFRSTSVQDGSTDPLLVRLREVYNLQPPAVLNITPPPLPPINAQTEEERQKVARYEMWLIQQEKDIDKRLEYYEMEIGRIRHRKKVRMV